VASREAGEMMERDCFEDLRVDGRIILKWILRSGKETWTGLMWPRKGIGAEL
jgi:hypothetical protein